MKRSPPHRSVDEPSKEDPAVLLGRAKATAIADAQTEVREYIRASFSEDDEATVANVDALLLGKATREGLTETEAGVVVGIALARQWVLAATAAAGDAISAIEAATTLEEVAAVTVDLAALGDPPEVSGGKIAVLLRGRP